FPFSLLGGAGDGADDLHLYFCYNLLKKQNYSQATKKASWNASYEAHEDITCFSVYTDKQKLISLHNAFSCQKIKFFS
ncbi:MAG: hypothetical protein KAQ71_11675, partial [Desulfobulbaceae bacterium]|nr:hypothetical protein [Desulfobulbaceae bacterium]